VSLKKPPDRCIVRADTFGTAGVTKLVTERGGCDVDANGSPASKGVVVSNSDASPPHLDLIAGRFGGTSPEPLRYACGNALQKSEADRVASD
jgi:hypothetical protein